MTGGNLEAPSIVYEILRDITERLWFVRLAEGTVHLTPRPEAQSCTRLTAPLLDDAGFGAVIERLVELFFVGMEWEKSLCVETHARGGNSLQLLDRAEHFGRWNMLNDVRSDHIAKLAVR